MASRWNDLYSVTLGLRYLLKFYLVLAATLFDVNMLILTAIINDDNIYFLYYKYRSHEYLDMDHQYVSHIYDLIFFGIIPLYSWLQNVGINRAAIQQRMAAR